MVSLLAGVISPSPSSFVPEGEVSHILEDAGFETGVR